MNEKHEQLDLFEFDRPVIKGYPELRWTGKRPYTSTQFFPAQLKEKYGEPDEKGWLNKIFWGDNLQVMSHLLKDYRGKIDLIYIDPPFDSKADYKKKVKLKGNTILNDNNVFEEKQYGDIWINDEYLQFMYERFILLRELLSDKGSIYLHCDWHKNSHLRLLMDEVFGPSNFRNEIVWWYLWGGRGKNQWNSKHDTILFYSKGENWTFNYKNVLDDHSLMTEGSKNRLNYKGAMVTTKSESSDIPADKVLPSDTWYIATINAMANEKENYPTQKPEELLTKIILASSNPGDIVFDCFMGSGTTQAVALKNGRRFIGADINLGAIQTTSQRLLNLLNKEKGLFPTNMVGFEVYNVNNYDFFRNPIEAKELLIEALGIQPFNASHVFDGELDGRHVKLLPVNRIATKADLSELVSNLPYKSYEKIKEDSEKEVVDRITLICMGHESDLVASFKEMVGKYNIDVELVDILLDKSNLEFKRDSKAKVELKNDVITVNEFYPMNLMQKLSLQEENVTDWDQLVDSIMIDYNYDGETLNPQIIDIPSKNEVVKGKYPIPSNHGRIRIKITDLLSESLEIEVK